MKRFAAALCFLTLGTCAASGQIKVGGMGDSLTDEVGIDTGTNLKGFLEILVASGKVDCGGSGVVYGHEDPRRGGGGGGNTSYEYNFAKGGTPVGDIYVGPSIYAYGYLAGGAPDYLRDGATCASPLTGSGKHSQVGSPTCPGSWGGLRQMAIDEGIDYGVMTLGGIEMLNSVIYGIPMAVTSPVNSTTLAYLDGMRDKLAEGLDLVTTGTGNNMKMVLGNLFDLGGTPISAGKTAAEKANIRAHVIEWNNRVAAVAAPRNIPILDWWGWWEDAVNNGVSLCGIAIDPHGTSPASDADLTILTSLTFEGVHPTPAGHALIANRFLDAIKTHYGENVELLTDQEIVVLTGLDPTATPPAAPTANGPVAAGASKITISALDPAATLVEVFVNDTLDGSADPGGAGSVQVTTSALGEGDSVTARQSDGCGVSAKSTAVIVRPPPPLDFSDFLTLSSCHNGSMNPPNCP